jgi:hypothetical protein
MEKLKWNLLNDLNDFELGDSGAKPGEWDGRNALYLDGFHTIPVLLREELPFDCYRIEAEIAVPGPNGFIGLVFGARDSRNYELVYISPGNDGNPGEIQYDPIMNGSSTWQIYNGPSYQAPAPFPAGSWSTFAIDVYPHGVSVYVGNDVSPRLVVSNLQHGRTHGNIGFWGNLPGYIRNLSVENIQPSAIAKKEANLQRLANASYITEWLVSEPSLSRDFENYDGTWTSAIVEENGCLNFNRLYSAGEKAVVRAKHSFSLKEASESTLSFGFSDRIRLHVNDQVVYEGETRWNPPGDDGRIRGDHARVPIHWKAGENTIIAEVTNVECMFGWGLAVKTGLPGDGQI